MWSSHEAYLTDRRALDPVGSGPTSHAHVVEHDLVPTTTWLDAGAVKRNPVEGGRLDGEK